MYETFEFLSAKYWHIQRIIIRIERNMEMPVAEKTATATELMKHTRRVLEEATKGPVSLIRPKKPTITLVAKDTWQQLNLAKDWFGIYALVVRYAVERAMKASPASVPADFAWLEHFGIDDVREFIDELSQAVYHAVRGMRSWDDVEAIVEEWRRSAQALVDEDLRKRFTQTLEDLRP
jgi:hypothetical protein